VGAVNETPDIKLQTGTSTGEKDRLLIDGATGDISFYEDTGTTPKFFWDASAESLGIGVSTSSNAVGDLVVGTSTGGTITLTRESEGYAQNDLIGRIDWFNEDNSGEGQNVAAYIGAYASGSLGDDAYLTFNTVAAATGGADAGEAMRIDSSGNVGIGTSSPSNLLHLKDEGYQLKLEDTSSGNTGEILVSDTSLYFFSDRSNAKASSDIRFSVDGSEAMRIDSSGNVGIGTSSPSQVLHVESSSVGVTRATVINTGNAAAGAGVQFVTKNGATQVSNATLRTDNAGNFSIFTGTTGEAERMRIDSSGNVGIGQAPTAFSGWKVLELKGGSTGSMINFEDSSSVRVGAIAFDDSSALRLQTFTALGMTFETNNTERMRLDSSGNLLVGKTSTATGAGFEARSDGQIVGTRSANRVAFLNRLTSDGDIVQFAKDGTTVGSIGTSNGRLQITAQDEMQLGVFGTPRVRIFSSLMRPETDNQYDLGISTSRFKDLYLSGGVYLGGTGAANKLDSYEEGDWNPTLQFGGSTSGIVYQTGLRSGKYSKVNGMVTITCRIKLTSKGTASGNARIANLPFATAATGMNGYLNRPCLIKFTAGGNGPFWVGVKTDGNNYIDLYSSNDGSAVTNAHFLDTMYMTFEMTYDTAS
jgi:hypothetical protein